VEPADPKLRAALTRPTRGLCAVAAERHAELLAAFDALLRASSGDTPHELSSRWGVLDAALRDHMEAEEDLIIPAFQLTAPEEGDELRTEHAVLRKMLDEIGRDVREQGIHTGRLRRLVELLRAHAAREDAEMYPWAEHHLPVVVRRQLYVRISHWLRKRRSQRV
jgi:hypothetical protein